MNTNLDVVLLLAKLLKSSVLVDWILRFEIGNVFQQGLVFWGLEPVLLEFLRSARNLVFHTLYGLSLFWIGDGCEEVSRRLSRWAVPRTCQYSVRTLCQQFLTILVAQKSLWLRPQDQSRSDVLGILGAMCGATLVFSGRS